MKISSNECDGEQKWYALFRGSRPKTIENTRKNMVWAWCNRKVAEEEIPLYKEWDRNSGSKANRWIVDSFPRSELAIKEIPLSGGKKGEKILDFHYVVDDYMIATENDAISEF